MTHHRFVLFRPCWSSPFQQRQLPPRPGSETFPSRTRLSAPPPPPERMSFIFSFNESIHIDDAWHWNPSDPIRLWTTWWRSSWVCSSSTSPRNSATSSWTLLLQIVTGFWKSECNKTSSSDLSCFSLFSFSINARLCCLSFKLRTVQPKPPHVKEISNLNEKTITVVCDWCRPSWRPPWARQPGVSPASTGSSGSRCSLDDAWRTTLVKCHHYFGNVCSY